MLDGGGVVLGEGAVVGGGVVLGGVVVGEVDGVVDGGVEDDEEDEFSNQSLALMLEAETLSSVVTSCGHWKVELWK